MSDNDNIFRIVDGGKEAPEKEPLPSNAYVIEDIDNNEYVADGFLIFTANHVAIMRETPAGAIPVTVVPLDRLKVAEIVEDDTQA